MSLDSFIEFYKENNLGTSDLINITAILTTIITGIVGIIKLILSMPQKSKKDKITKISKVAEIYGFHIVKNYICMVVSMLLILPIAYFADNELKLSNGTFVLIASIVIIIPMLIINICSKKGRKKIDESFISRKRLNTSLFYLPIILLVLEVIISLYTSFFDLDNRYNTFFGITTIIVPVISLLFYFMAIKKFNMYKDVDIHFKNTYQERKVSYNNYSLDERFIVIISEDKLTYKKYNIDNITKIVINCENIDDEYRKHLSKRGFAY